MGPSSSEKEKEIVPGDGHMLGKAGDPSYSQTVAHNFHFCPITSVLLQTLNKGTSSQANPAPYFLPFIHLLPLVPSFLLI